MFCIFDKRAREQRKDEAKQQQKRTLSGSSSFIFLCTEIDIWNKIIPLAGALYTRNCQRYGKNVIYRNRTENDGRPRTELNRTKKNQTGKQNKNDYLSFLHRSVSSELPTVSCNVQWFPRAKWIFSVPRPRHIAWHRKSKHWHQYKIFVYVYFLSVLYGKRRIMVCLLAYEKH